MTCKMKACMEKAIARGFCAKHYVQEKRAGRLSVVQTKSGLPMKFLSGLTRRLQTIRKAKCLIWPYARDNHGYAQMLFEGKISKVSRIVCEAVHGKPPIGKPFSIHNCDCGHLGCIEPTHLEWGSHRKNQRDRLRAGTDPNGERNGKHKLTTKQVESIRKKYATGKFSQSQLGRSFKVSPQQISSIVKHAQRKIA